MKNAYLTIEEMILMINQPSQSLCRRILVENRDLFEEAPGASHNHQVWKGGYLDHIQEVMNIGIVMYRTFQDIRPLPFSLSDALLVLFLHDLEKPWRYASKKMGEGKEKKILRTKEDRRAFRDEKLQEYGFACTKEQKNALRYVEGELDDYTPLRRVMNPLAAFCHIADITSARIWFDYPRQKNDSWKK